ncbi:MAG: hypothetical protein ACKO4Q_05255 [Planctomycetota bacterium]
MAFAVGVAIALRAWEALESSLWLDELHTLSHASLPTLGAVIEHVRAEVVHQPLFFGVVHCFGGWEEGAALRFLPALSSLLLFLPVIAFARAAGLGARGVALAAWLLACLPYQVHYATELRPYAWLAVFSAGAMWAAFSEHGSRIGRLALFAACVAAGVLTHRIMEVVVVSIGAARLLVRSREMVPLAWLVGAGALAVAPEVPWLLAYAQQATNDRLEYHADSGGFVLRRALVLEGLALPTRLFAPFLGALGGGWALLAKLGAAVFFLVVGGGLVAAWRGRASATPLGAPVRALGLAALCCFTLVFALSFYRWDRLPLQYFAPVAWALPVAVAVLAERWPERSRAQFAGLVALSALALGIAQAGGRNMEDMRGAVAAARELGSTRGEALFTGLMVQPSLFSHTLAYDAYGRELPRVEPDSVPRRGEPGFERPVVLLRRGRIPLTDARWARLLEGRSISTERKIDDYLAVFVLEPAP